MEISRQVSPASLLGMSAAARAEDSWWMNWL
jgi:hypothetical protein